MIQSIQMVLRSSSYATATTILASILSHRSNFSRVHDAMLSFCPLSVSRAECFSSFIGELSLSCNFFVGCSSESRSKPEAEPDAAADAMQRHEICFRQAAMDGCA